jgi:hypothetical protein
MSLWNRLWAAVFGEKTESRSSGSVPARSPSAPVVSGEEARATYGVSPTDPILCDQPSGERAYIATLRCPSGHRLGGPRRGSMQGKCPDPRHHVFLIALPGVTVADVCHVDCYDLRCEGGEYSCSLYFDLYHPGAPPQPAPRGLTRM